MTSRVATPRLLGAIITCALVTPAVALAEGVPIDEPAFTDFVAQKMRDEITPVPVGVRSPLLLSVGSLVADLKRVHGFCKSNAEGCAAEVGSFVKGVAEVVREQNAPLDKKAIRLVVRASRYLEIAQASLGADGPVIQSKPFVEGLAIVPVLDTPHSVRPLDNRDLEKLNLSQEEVLELGRANLEANLKPLAEVAQPAAAGQLGKIGGNVFETSRLLLPGGWAKLAEAQGGVLLVSVPTTDLLLYISGASPPAIDTFRTFSRSVMAKSPNPLSPAILNWTPGGWEVVP